MVSVKRQWLPIQTAPNGQRVLLFCPHDGIFQGERRDATEHWLVYWNAHFSAFDRYEDDIINSTATHWMPLPEPPKGADALADALAARCYDCALPYSDDGFADLVVAHEAWAKISPTGHEGGLLCPTCMVRRATKAGLSNVRAIFRSGPFASEAPTPLPPQRRTDSE
jgi:hypothetical protein